VLDRGTNDGSTGEPWTGMLPSKKSLAIQEAIRLRNKLNAKKSRERKKHHRLKELEDENERLRKSK
jgi:hypothetical protein